MIAESTPFGGIDMKVNASDPLLADPWRRWFEPVLNLIELYDIAMWSYINCDWDSQPMWHNVGFGETRVSSDPSVMKKWLDFVTNRRYGERKFLMAGSLDDCGGTITSSSTDISVTSFVPTTHSLNTGTDFSARDTLLIAFLLGVTVALSRRSISKIVQNFIRFITQPYKDCADTNSHNAEEERAMLNGGVCTQAVYVN